MTEIRPADKLFLAVVVPLAVVAAYVCLWRTDAVRRTDELARLSVSLVAVEDFDSEIAHARKQLRSAEEELTAERRIPMPETKVRGDAEDTPAARERAVHSILRQTGLRLVRSTRVAAEKAVGADGVAALAATGIRPEPFCRAYEVDGAYPALRQALKLIVDRKLPVLTEAIVRSASARWKLVLIL